MTTRDIIFIGALVVATAAVGFGIGELAWRVF